MRMPDDMGSDAHSVHSVGVVENPLFAEEQNYSYSDLKKDQDAQVRQLDSC